MPVIKVIFRDEVYLRVESDKSIEKRLEKFFSFATPLRKYKNEFAKWDGTYRLYYPDGRKLYAGLFPRLEEFAKEQGHTIRKYTYPKGKDGKAIVDDSLLENALYYPIGSRIEKRQFREWVEKLKLPNESFKVQDHERASMLRVLIRNRAIMLIRPEDDKHPLLYHFLRWFLKEGRKCLLIVWSKETVERLYKRFEMDDHIQKLYYPLSKKVEKPILIASWQSVYKQPEEWLDRFDAVIVDEINKFRPKSTSSKSTPLKSIMEKMTKTRHRIGIVNSRETPKMYPVFLEGLFGPVEEAWNQGKSKKHRHGLNVTCLHLKYPDAIKEKMEGVDRHEEIKFLQQHDKRNNYIANLACELNGNTLALVMNLNHGRVLYDLIREKVQQEELNKEVLMNEEPTNEDKDGWIVIATFQSVYSGFHVRCLDNIIFSSPGKNKIQNLKSIGSGLEPRKYVCRLYDLVDDLRLGNKKNHLIKDGQKRMDTYKQEKKNGLSVKIVPEKIEGQGLEIWELGYLEDPPNST